MAKSEPSRNPSFLNAFGDFEAPEKKITARWEGGLLTCLRNWRFHRLTWSKMLFIFFILKKTDLVCVKI
jgi:hypothetical protein